MKEEYAEFPAFNNNQNSSEESIFLKDVGINKMLIEYAIKEIVRNHGSYSARVTDAGKLLNTSTFYDFWNFMPSIRGELFNICINNMSYGYSTLDKSLSKKVVEDIYDWSCGQEDLSSLATKLRIAALIKPEFDYLDELCKYSIDPDDLSKFDLCYRYGIDYSKDPEFYNFVWARVDRHGGATEQKIAILEAAFSKSVEIPGIIKQCAKSSTKNIKRCITKNLSSKIQTYNSQKYYYGYSETGQNAELDKKIAKYEELAMLFVGCDDFEVCHNLVECLSKDNIPWLLPSIAKHDWLKRKVERILDKKE